MDIENTDESLAKIEVGLINYLFSLKGYATRAIQDLDNKLPSYVTISKQIKEGEAYFKRIYPLIEEIKDLLIEKNIKEGKFNLNLTPEEMKSALEMFKNTPKAQKEFPELYKKLQEGNLNNL
jgi:hypothetical protein